jgi:hypothetical protein
VKESFIISLDGFCNCNWRNFQSSWNFLHLLKLHYFRDWLTFMS